MLKSSEGIKVSAIGRSLLACPRTHMPLNVVDGNSRPHFRVIGRAGFSAPQVGKTDILLVTADDDRAFPVIDGVPALMWPEVLNSREADVEPVHLHDLRYFEAYSEMEFYNPVGYAEAKKVEQTGGYKNLKKIIDDKVPVESFPQPEECWLDMGFDMQASLDCLRYVAPVKDKVVVQVGGQGRGAIRLLLAGAAEAILITPMIGECAVAWRMAESLGVSDRLSCVLGVGEEIPLRNASADIVISLGCLHHMRLDLALPEFHRVLKVGGKFAAVDPWRAPLYGLGTKLFGKREQGILNRSKSIFCQPLTSARISPLEKLFPTYVMYNHGPILRYPLLVLNKFGISFTKGLMLRLSRLDDRIGAAIGLSQNWGGSVMIGGERLPSAMP